LFILWGATNCNTTFAAAFGLIDNEQRPSFDFLFNGMEELRVKINAALPGVLVTDRDERMKGAAAAIWPRTIQQLCIFHVLKNVQTNLAKKWKKTLAEEEASDRDDLTDTAAVAPEEAEEDQGLEKPIKHNQDSFMELFRRLAFAKTTDLFMKA